uniref:Uncharacterized protein n=1 Tax=Anguilla anguilla TaxID=7936 RepID=A0A0E9W0E1_ANGAN
MYILTVIQSDEIHYVLMVEGSPKPKGGQSKEQGIHESVKCLPPFGRQGVRKAPAHTESH